MSPALLAGLAGLAFLDSFNPATLGAVALILLAAPHRPGWTALASVMGAAITVFGVGAILFISAGAAAATVDGIVVALRFIAFGAAAVALALAGFRRLRARLRRPIALPTWFGFATALPFGVILTAADLPNAFPYFIAIERLVDADVDTTTALITLAVYTSIYCLPCLVLLAIGLGARQSTRTWLQKLVSRFGSGTVTRSIPIAIIWWLAALVVATVPFVLLAP